MKSINLFWIIPITLVLGIFVASSFMTFEIKMDENTRESVKEMSSMMKNKTINQLEKELALCEQAISFIKYYEEEIYEPNCENNCLYENSNTKSITCVEDCVSKEFYDTRSTDDVIIQELNKK